MAVTMGVRDCFLEQVTVELEGQGGERRSRQRKFSVSKILKVKCQAVGVEGQIQEEK